MLWSDHVVSFSSKTWPAWLGLAWLDVSKKFENQPRVKGTLASARTYRCRCVDVDVDVDIDYNHRETRSQNGGRIGLEKTANDPRSLNFLHQVMKELVECIDDFSQDSFVKV